MRIVQKLNRILTQKQGRRVSSEQVGFDRGQEFVLREGEVCSYLRPQRKDLVDLSRMLRVVEEDEHALREKVFEVDVWRVEQETPALVGDRLRVAKQLKFLVEVVQLRRIHLAGLDENMCEFLLHLLILKLKFCGY